jgi:hypothetical protein
MAPLFTGLARNLGGYGFGRSAAAAGGGAPAGLTATGGIISDYPDSGNVYRAHIFTSSGTFTVTAPGAFGDTVEYLVVAGGGGGGNIGGGGGAGGFRTNLTGHPLAGSPFPVSPGPYGVTVGAGGNGSQYTVRWFRHRSRPLFKSDHSQQPQRQLVV